MATYQHGSRPGNPEDDLAAFLQRDLERHPEAKHFPALFASLTPEEQFARLRTVLQKPLGGALVGLLREEPQVLERLVAHSLPAGAGAPVRHEHRVAVFAVADSPKAHRRPLAEVLARLLDRVRDRAHKARHADRRRGAQRLDYRHEPPEVAQHPPVSPDDAEVARITVLAGLTKPEDKVFRAMVQLMCEDPGLRGKPPLRLVAQLAGLSYGRARVVSAAIDAKLHKARRAEVL